MGFATQNLPRDWRPRVAAAAGITCEYLSRLRHNRTSCSIETAVKVVEALQGLGLDVSLEEVMNLPMPIPVNVRLRECDPVLTDRQLAELERRQYALLGYCPEDHEPPPAPPDDDRQLDLVEYARRAAG